MKRVVIFLTLIFFGLKVTGQVNKFGVPLIRNYPTQMTPGSEQNWCITKDKFGNLYFGNQDRGVIRYDGTKWSGIQIGNNPRIFSLESDSRGIVYVGAAFEFGYLQPDKKGKTEYISLVSRVDSVSEIRVVYSIVVNDDMVLYASPGIIYMYNILNDSLTKISLRKFNLNDSYKFAKINDKLIIVDNVEGIFELKDTVISPLPGGEFFKKKNCTVLLPFDEDRILISTFYDGLFIYNYKTGVINNDFIDRQINEKLKIVGVYAATKLRDDLFAIGTTNQEGILVFNKSGELIQQITKENCELEDNTIIALYCDYKSNSELWISTTGVISKAYFNIPITQFAEKQGIESGVNEICEFQNSLYLSSDAGILKSFTDNKNNIRFKKVPGINSQVFPLEVIKSTSGDFLLAGSRNGVLQIMKNDVIRRIETNGVVLPGLKTFVFKAIKIVQSSVNPEIVYLGLETGGILILKYEGDHWRYINRIQNIPGSIAGIVEKKEGGFWFLSDDPSLLYNLTISGKDTTWVKYDSEKGIPDIDLNSLHSIKDDIYVTSSKGILKYDKSTDKFLVDNKLTRGYSEGKNTRNLFIDNDNDIWYMGLDEFNFEMLFRNSNKGIQNYQGVLKLLPDVPALDIIDYNSKIYMTKSKIVSVLDKVSLKPDSSKLNTLFVTIKVGTDSAVMSGTFHTDIDDKRRKPELFSPSVTVPVYSYDMNEISFEWTTPYYIEELLTEYSYKLDGFDKEWSKWEGISFGNTMEAQYSKKEYTNLPYGRYTFKVKARSLTGIIGNELNYEFIILKPWYATILAYFGFALVVFLIIFVIIKAYTRKLKNENIRLEGIVAERTAVVVKQKEELESSIHYASRIQMALLPSEAILKENIRNYFVLFKPRDIVSGDFYWMTKKGDRLYIVAADCTGHGVPGAFMSLLGMSFLDEIIEKHLAPSADYVLHELRLHVTESLKQVGSDDEAKDGMDMGLLVIDFSTQRIEFSGAYNPCFRVRKLTEDETKNYHDDSIEMADGSMSNGKYLLETIPASKMPIGISSRMNEEFVFHDWALEKGISYYLFSDGYIDQFGGPHGRKFMKKSFKRLILDIQDHPMNKQKELLDNNLKEWKGCTPQIDDILIMGIRTE